jgi:hypothetical protein
MGYLKSNYKPTTPQLILPENEMIDKMAVLAELELIDTFETYSKNLGNAVAKEAYVHLAEIYSFEHDKKYQYANTLLSVEGVIVEMYSDIFKFENQKGESEKTKSAKARILILKEGIEILKAYIVKHDQMQLMLKNSIIVRQQLSRENNLLKKQVNEMKKSYDEL